MMLDGIMEVSMLKYVYRAIILIAIFVGALFYFSKDIKEVVFNVNNTITMEDATLPLVTLKTDDRVMNMLHGYSSNIAANKIREAVTPLGADQTFEVLFKNGYYKVKKLNYEVREFAGNKLIENSSVSVFENSDDYKSAKIKLNASLEQEKDYAVKITLITSKSEKIYYYNRIKVSQQARVKDDIDFVMNFHKAILNKKTAESMQLYLGTPTNLDKKPNLANVSMDTSDLDTISWGNMKPTVITKVVPTVKEIYEQMALIELDYYIEAKVNGNIERYRVTEFFRIRYGTDRMHLYNYERHMESIFDINMADAAKSQLKLGITSNTQIPYMPSVDHNKLAFVRDGALWLYDLNKNEVTRIFSFEQKKSDYIRDLYNQHDIRILDMDAEGNIDFLVYGYMNRGQYEGHVGILLYRFVKAENRIEELVYVPVEEPYQSLKENIGDLTYVSTNAVFYFNIYNSIYAYDMITQNLSVIASDVDKNQVVILPGSKVAAWQDNADLKKSTKVNIMDLDTDKIQTITAPDGYNIRLLDKIDTNIVYGFVKNNSIVSLVDGSIVAPISTVEIATANKKILKTYNKPNYFITGVSVKDNILELHRIKKTGEGGSSYEAASSDYIMNQIKSENPLVGVVSRASDKDFTEYFMKLPKGFEMVTKPKVLTTVNTVISQDPTLRLPELEQKHTYYYPYVTGGIAGAFENASDAITVARNKVGVVMSNRNQLVWMRGVQAIVGEHTITGLDSMSWQVGSDQTVQKCIKLMLQHQGTDASLDKLNIQGSSAYQVLKDNSSYTPIRLTGTSLEDTLYYIAMNRPIIGMKDSSHAVLIYGYDQQNIKVIDPSTNSVRKIGLNDARQMFESAGNVFISYLEQ